MKKPWIQAAVDVDELELGKEIAEMAVSNGAEWIETGTPLLYRYGYEAICQLKNIVGNRAKVIADYKYFHGPTMIPRAAEAGADLILMEDIYQDHFVEEALELAGKYHIRLVYSMLSKKPSDYVERGLRLVSLGVQYLFMWRTVAYEGKTYETFKDMRSAADVFIGVSDDNLESAVAAAREGADWITFGTVLKANDPASCRQWIDAIHSAW